jgi:LPXTG-motif cell wall-anchored protein
VLFDLQRILIAFAAGALVIILGAFFLARRRR